MHIHSNLSLSTRSVSFSFSFFTRSVFRCLSFFQVDSSIQHVLNRMFISSKKASFYFSTLTHNDRGYGHLAVCGSIRCRETTRWMREQNCRNARQPANEHRRVLCVRCLSFLFVFCFRFWYAQSLEYRLFVVSFNACKAKSVPWFSCKAVLF